MFRQGYRLCMLMCCCLKNISMLLSLQLFNENDYTIRSLIWFDVVDFYFTCIPMQ